MNEPNLYLCIMFFHRKSLFALASCISLLALQTAWICHSYQLEHQLMMNSINDAFHQAYQKEQTYRIPVVDIVNPGAITIESCGNEEILIVRKCPEPDTIAYNNVSGHSIESFLSNVFVDLREQIVPLNIYCLADLFAGMLHDKDIPVAFVLERFDANTGDILETSFLSGKKPSKIASENIITSKISDKEAIRAVLKITMGTVLARMTGTLACTFCLFTIILIFIIISCRNQILQHDNLEKNAIQTNEFQNDTFRIGKFHFDPAKNELTGFGETILLNKKENSILYALCIKQGNIIERNVLLEENWGSLGMVYSRSLDTYLTTLRKYLKKDPTIQIITVKGVGYKLVYE